MVAVYATALAMFLVITLVPLLARMAEPLGLLDQPGPRKIHNGAVPRVGGIAIATGAIVSVLVWVPLRPEVLAYACGSLVIFVFGVLDDRLTLDYRIKLIGQIIGAVTFVYVGEVHLTRMPFVFDGQIPAWIGVPFTVFVIVGITNAVNMSDGMDGLAGGTSLLAAGALGYLIYLGGDKQITMLALAVVGATLGFLRYNTHPARVFMGDAGSQFLGFSVVALALLLIERCNTAVSPLVPLLLLALPIIDTLQVIVVRLRAGVSPFSPDRRHLHHRLLDAGLSQYQVVLVIYGLQILLIALAWWLLYARDLTLAAVFFAYAAALLLLIGWWQRRHSQGKPLIGAFHSIEPLIGYLRDNGVVLRVGSYGVVLGVSILFPVIALSIGQVSSDVGWLSLLLFLAMLLSLLPKPLIPPMAANRLASFGCAVIVVYLASSGSFVFDELHRLLTVWFLVIAALIAIWLRFGDSREFRLNTLDVLVILIVAVVPNMPVVREAGMGPMVLKALLLFYACELILSEQPRYWKHFRFSVISVLGILVVRGVLL